MRNNDAPVEGKKKNMGGDKNREAKGIAEADKKKGAEGQREEGRKGRRNSSLESKEAKRGKKEIFPGGGRKVVESHRRGRGTGRRPRRRKPRRARSRGGGCKREGDAP